MIHKLKKRKDIYQKILMKIKLNLKEISIKFKQIRKINKLK